MGKKKKNTRKLVTAVILANEARYRQNKVAEFDTEYALTFVKETVAGSEETAGKQLSFRDIYNILQINNYYWEAGIYNRTERVNRVAQVFGVVREDAGHEDDEQFDQYVEEFDLADDEIVGASEKYFKVQEALTTVIENIFQ